MTQKREKSAFGLFDIDQIGLLHIDLKFGNPEEIDEIKGYQPF